MNERTNLLLPLLCLALSVALPSATRWQTLGGTPQRNGFTEASAPTQDVYKAWQPSKVPYVQGQPTISSTGEIYVTTNSMACVKYSRGSTEPMWSFAGQGNFNNYQGISGPTISDNELTIYPVLGYYAYSVDSKTGTQRWATQLPAIPLSGPLIVSNLVVVGAPTTCALFGLDTRTGEQVWTHYLNGRFACQSASPPILTGGQDQLIIASATFKDVGTRNTVGYTVVALNLSGGVVWNTTVMNNPWPAAVVNNIVSWPIFTTSQAGKGIVLQGFDMKNVRDVVIAFDASTGQQQFQFTVPFQLFSGGMAIDNMGRLLITGFGAGLFHLNGSYVWMKKDVNSAYSVPVVAGNNVGIFGDSYNGILRAVNLTNGTWLWYIPSKYGSNAVASYGAAVGPQQIVAFSATNTDFAVVAPRSLAGAIN